MNHLAGIYNHACQGCTKLKTELAAACNDLTHAVRIAERQAQRCGGTAPQKYVNEVAQARSVRLAATARLEEHERAHHREETK